MKKIEDIFSRALKTFIQAFCGYFATYAVAILNGVDFGDLDNVKSVILGLIVSAIAAGLSAVMNLYINHKNK